MVCRFGWLLLFGYWFHDAVYEAFDKGLVKGTSADHFSPVDNLTRGMFVTVLYRMENEPDAEGVTFDDVENEAYYADAVRWANANGVVLGVTDELFAPNINITREQISAIIYRYAKFKGMDEFEREELTYNDAEDIEEYAVEAVEFCKAKGIMIGDKADNFKPKDNATRAEMAMVLVRLVDFFSENKAK